MKFPAVPLSEITLHTLAGNTILNWLVGEEKLNDASRNGFAQLRGIMDLSEITGAYTNA